MQHVFRQRRYFLKLKFHFQLWRNRFIYNSRCDLIKSVFTARRNSRILSSTFHSFRFFQRCCTRSSETVINQPISFLVTRHSLSRRFFFISNVFCLWRRAVHYVRRMVLVQSLAFLLRPMLLQWHMVAAQERVSPFPSRAMHFSELLRAQSISREILLQPSTLLALRHQSQDQSTHKNIFWSQPLHPGSLPSQIYSPKTHVITANASPTGPVSERPSTRISRIVPYGRPAWIPSSLAVTGAGGQSKQRTGLR